MAGKSILDGRASQAYESCHGPRCERVATKAVALTSVNEHGADVEIVPLCKSCHKTAQKNAQIRGLAEPRATRLTKSVAQAWRDQDSPKGRAAPINPHKSTVERLRGERLVNSSRPHLVGKAPESMTRAHTININRLDPEHAMGLNIGVFDKSDNPIVQAFQGRHHDAANRRRTPEQKEDIINEVRKGLKNGK